MSGEPNLVIHGVDMMVKMFVPPMCDWKLLAFRAEPNTDNRMQVTASLRTSFSDHVVVTLHEIMSSRNNAIGTDEHLFNAMQR